jgi:GT2 family glycosyltransferase
MSQAPTISIVTINWNSLEHTRDCLESLEAQTHRDFETIVVDNGSTDGSLESIRERFPWVILVDAGENLGFAEGCNRGIAVARGEWILTLNNDTCVQPNLIDELLRAVANASERLGMIQCQMRFKNRPERTNSTGIVMFGNGTARDRDFDKPAPARSEPCEIFVPTAGAALYRRAMLEQTQSSRGFFDRAYFMYSEDLDLGWRCRLAGWRAVYWPSAVVLHAFQASSKRVASDFVEWHCRKNRAATLAKNASWRFLARTAPRTLTDLVWVSRRRGLAGLKQYFEGVSEALGLRAEVERIRRVPRARLERRWVGR